MSMEEKEVRLEDEVAVAQCIANLTSMDAPQSQEELCKSLCRFIVNSDIAQLFAARLNFEIPQLLAAKDAINPQSICVYLGVSCALLSTSINDLGQCAIDLVPQVSQLIERTQRFEKSDIRRFPKRVLAHLLTAQPQLFEPLLTPLISTTLGSQSAAASLLCSAASMIRTKSSKNAESSSSSATSSHDLRSTISKHHNFIIKLWEDGVVGSRDRLAPLMWSVGVL